MRCGTIKQLYYKRKTWGSLFGGLPKCRGLSGYIPHITVIIIVTAQAYDINPSKSISWAACGATPAKANRAPIPVFGKNCHYGREAGKMADWVKGCTVRSTDPLSGGVQAADRRPLKKIENLTPAPQSGVISSAAAPEQPAALQYSGCHLSDKPCFL